MHERPGVLVLSRSYPNPQLPLFGVWAERLTIAAAEFASPVVLAPVGYVPPGVPLASFARFRKVPRQEQRAGIRIQHTRVPALPGYALHAWDARLSYPFLRRAADRLMAEHGFRLIHAHFIYPEGVIAARLGRRYGVPVVTTEHAVWLPWLERYPAVRRQVVAALPDIALVTAVSRSMIPGMTAAAGRPFRVEVLPNMVPEDTFTLPARGQWRDPDLLVFVGVVRHVKGLDVLIRALPELIRRRPGARLLVLGDPFFRQYRRDTEAVRALVGELGLSDRVVFAGGAPPAEVADHLGRAAVLAVPSRRESFGTVLVEALATGTPVVATRCGGPEEILTDEVGRLVPVDDPGALAAALAEVMAHPEQYPAERLRAYAVSRWGSQATTGRLRRIYEAVAPGEAWAVPAAAAAGSV